MVVKLAWNRVFLAFFQRLRSLCGNNRGCLRLPTGSNQAKKRHKFDLYCAKGPFLALFESILALFMSASPTGG